MDIYWYILFFVSGIVFGSFFHVVGIRVPLQIPFTKGRSYCPHCHKPLTWYELIPIVSYIFLRGKCRKCQQPIAPLYPFMECATGFLFAYSYWKTGFTMELITVLILISMLMILFVTDFLYMLLPNKILMFFLPLFISMRILSPLQPWYDAVIGAVVGFAILALLIILSKGGMGAGDMKLFAILGIVLGWKAILLTLFLGAFLGLIVGGIMILLHKIERKQPIPFGPFIIIAALISYFYSGDIISIYVAFFI